MKLLEIKSGVRKYCVCENLLITIDEFNQILSNNEVLHISKEPLQEVYCTNSTIYTNDFNSNGILINDQEVRLFAGNFVKLIFKDTMILSQGKCTHIYIKENLTAKLNSKLFIYFYNYQNQSIYYYSKKSNEILEFNIVQNLQKWKYSLETLLPFEYAEQKIKVIEISGLFNNHLVCTLNNGGILILDSTSGDKKYYFSNTGIVSGLFQKKENTSVFIGLKHHKLIEVDIISGEILKNIDISQHLKKLANIPNEKPCWLSVGTCKFYDNLFYFYGDNNLIVVFDPKLEKIIDHHWFKFKDSNTILKIGNENLHIEKDRVYCLDSKNELHIFERE
jgi:hypothetical protein